MALTINWSDGAIADFKQITKFINNRWSEKDATKFVLKAESIIKVILNQPYLYPESSFNQLRKAIITKQTSVYYLIQGQEIHLITFWDNRQNPNSNPF
ncbi:MAG: type II toxin-antitoxin system RelE/ParE family toxin [Mucilaginibacter sp.]|uniref:type II toxin-antitoxin system RelE/ParE family toxin n=1 Tax=Mucilaginibacter sp. TaxID=1882438 RepID=UPI0034E58A00